MSSQINDLLKNETIYYRKSHLLKKPHNQYNKLFRRTVIQDSLNQPSHPINSLIRNEEVFAPYFKERNSLGKLLNKPCYQSNREIKNKQLVKPSLKIPTNQKICAYLHIDPPNTNRSQGQKTKTQSTTDSFYSFFTLHKYNSNFLLKHKFSEPLSQ
ncbi:unnamed protein product (macronuclear) [Paramecium tetraurelia]|uniref:Uncharacterized protein n=1 Tax=Paramecium tetraurelia TaxID=5888 RepID=A0DT93_PARTE|nr:uncharacterized protein GSPATT00019953001 [Paramecium tetraurelia]CAK86260.1 unnamed protein product [Paramecium tetraurelia]|eukprot:XP_001453657.1 hypothetical protein (macronuclear) [Paramecium tetraurelia strain d4-2]